MALLSQQLQRFLLLANSGELEIAVSRAFGDIRFKTKKDEMLKKGVEQKRCIKFNGDLVVASPDAYQVSLGTDSEFIVLAFDGLWDLISSTEAVYFVRNQLRQYGDIQASGLAKLAAAAATAECIAGGITGAGHHRHCVGRNLDIILSIFVNGELP